MCNRVATPEARAAENAFNAKISNHDLYKVYHHVNTWDKPLLPTIHGDNMRSIVFDEWRTFKSGEFDTYNARNDKVFNYDAENIRNNRVLVIVKGFYEYQAVKGKSYPYFIQVKDREAYALGGFINKFGWLSILTTEPNKTMAFIHNKAKRMPFILTPDMHGKWLTQDLLDQEITDMMQPCPDEIMKFHTVGKIPQKPELNNVPQTACEYVYPELQQKDLFE